MKASDKRPLGRTGVQVSRMGQGTGPMGAIHYDETWAENIKTARNAGIAYFDTSPYYGFGNSEIRLGRQLSKLNRGDFVLSTKVGRLLRREGDIDEFAAGYYYPQGMPDNVMRTVYDYSSPATAQSLKESRQRLGFDQIDIVHIHDIIEVVSGKNHVQEAIHETFPVLREMRSKRQIKAIGAGCQVNQLFLDLGADCDFDCFLVAGRYTLLDQSALAEVLPMCQEKGIAVIIGSPYNTGILHDPKPDATFDFVQAPRELIEKAQRMKAVCERHGVPLPAAALQFPFGHPSVATILTGAVRTQEIEENVRLLEHDIPNAMWDDLKNAGLLDRDAPVPTTSAAH